MKKETNEISSKFSFIVFKRNSYIFGKIDNNFSDIYSCNTWILATKIFKINYQLKIIPPNENKNNFKDL